MKKLLRFALVALFGLLCILGLLFFFRNAFIESAVEGAGEYALGVPTPLEQVRTDLGSGDFALIDYRISNPEGFSDEPVFALGSASMNLPLMRLSGTDELRIPEVRVEGLAVRLERTDEGFNFQPLLARIDEVTKKGPAPGGPEQPEGIPPTEPQASRPIVIEKLVLADWTLALDFGGPLKLPATGLDTLVLENVRTDGQGLPGILAQVVEQLLAYVQSEGLGSVGLGDLDPELLAQIDALRTALDEGLDIDALRADLEGRIDSELEDAEKKAQEKLDELRSDTKGKIEEILEEHTGGELPPGAAQEIDKLLNRAGGAELPEDLKSKAKDLLEKATGDGSEVKELEEKAKKELQKLFGGN